MKYTDPDSTGFSYSETTLGHIARHPATTYEMIGDLLILGVMALLFIKLWERRPGVTFFTGVVLYSAMRFGVSYLRIDSGPHCPALTGCPEYLVKNWMTFPQVVSTITFAIGVVGLAWTLIRAPQGRPARAAELAQETAALRQSRASTRYRA